MSKKSRIICLLLATAAAVAVLLFLNERGKDREDNRNVTYSDERLFVKNVPYSRAVIEQIDETEQDLVKGNGQTGFLLRSKEQLLDYCGEMEIPASADYLLELSEEHFKQGGVLLYVYGGPLCSSTNDPYRYFQFSFSDDGRELRILQAIAVMNLITDDVINYSSIVGLTGEEAEKLTEVKLELGRFKLDRQN